MEKEETLKLEFEKPTPHTYGSQEGFIMWGKPDKDGKKLWVAPTLEDLWKVYAERSV